MASKTFYASKDAFMGKAVGGSFSGWNGKDDHLPVGEWQGGNWKSRSVIYFPISFAGMDAIQSATFKFYEHATGTNVHAVQTSAPSSIDMVRMTKDWGEGTDIGEGQLTSTLNWDWDNRFDAFTSTGKVTFNVTIGSNGDVTSVDGIDIVTAWFNGANNFGIMLKHNNETDDARGVEFFSREASGGDFRAEVTIVYSANTPPGAPTSLDPTGGEVVTSTLPSFTGTHNDADSGDYITAVQVQVIKQSDSSLMWDSGAVVVSGHPSQFSVSYGSVGTFVPLSSGTVYQWRAKTRDKGNEWSTTWTAYQSFEVNNAPNAPLVQLVLSPPEDLPDSTPDIRVTHNDIDPTDDKMFAYQFIVYVRSPGVINPWTPFWDTGIVDISGAPLANVVVTSTSLTPGTTYYAAARTRDEHGSWSAYGSSPEFTIHNTGVPINLSPSSSESVGATPVLAGERATAVDSIVSYDIIVYTDDLASTMWSSGTQTSGIVGGATFSKTYAGSALTSGQFYQWKARITAGGVTSEYSSLQRFQVVDATVPSLSVPSGTGNSLTPTFTGSRTASFNRFQYEIYPSTSTTINLGTVIYQSGTQSTTIGAGGLGTQFTKVYPGTPALTYATTYKWRARVSSDAGANWSGWSGLVSFATDSAGTAVLNSPTNNQWITDATPDFRIDRDASTSDTIDQMQVRVWNASGTTMIWDSGMTDVANGTSNVGPITYAGTALSPGTTYSWDARYQKTGGAAGSYSGKRSFRLNGPPYAPGSLFPPSDHVFADTVLPVFEAVFSDPEVAGFGDTPSEWEIVVEEDDGTPVDTVNITTSLIVGVNSYTWTVSDSVLVFDQEYRWRTRFKDSKNEWGPYSGYQDFTCATSPDGTIATPSDGSTVDRATPDITWSFSGGTQAKYEILIRQTDSDGVIINGPLGAFFERTGTATSFAVPAGHFQDQKYYDITLTVYNTAHLSDPTPSTVNVQAFFDPPNSITGLTPTSEENYSYISLDWDQPAIKSGHTFVTYYIYRRVQGDISWQLIGTVGKLSRNEFNDYRAGHGIKYEYRVTNATTKTGVGVEMESPDDPDGGSIVPAVLDSDVWICIHNDRSPEHTFVLPIGEESHERPVQQEAFEVLGSDRKVIITGFVLGYEGSVTMTWVSQEVPSLVDFQVLYDETIIGRRALAVMVESSENPWLLKSPFGDVWDVVFSTPSYKWISGGHLEVSLGWVETGDPGVTSI